MDLAVRHYALILFTVCLVFFVVSGFKIAGHIKAIKKLRRERLAPTAPARNGEAYVMMYKPTRKEKILHLLGFRGACNPDMDDLENAPGFAPGYCTAACTAVFDIRDRIRILFGGAVSIRICIKTDKPIEKMVNRSTVAVPWIKKPLAPGH